MARRSDIDDLLSAWVYQPGTISARLVRAKNGRQVVQFRVDLGVLQMEIQGRPDGKRPGGMETYLDLLSAQAVQEGDNFQLTERQKAEVDREFQQYYYRRICWLALHEFRRALADADHTLSLMDFVATHARDLTWIATHERYRPFVVFQRSQAAALAALGAGGPEAAIKEIDEGLRQLRMAAGSWQEEADGLLAEEEEMTGQLLELKEWIRGYYQVGRTLDEQLADAVASEKYELAAQLRDEIARRRRARSA